MKIVILIGDGMGDYPVESLGQKTPLQAARIPHLRTLAAQGEPLTLRTVPPALPPGSDVANLGLLGYDATVHYTGRAPIEAAGAGIPLAPGDIAYRCNLVTLRDGCMADYSAGHIDTETATELVTAIDAEFGRDGLRFHPGVSYRHLLVWHHGPDHITSQPPHDIADQPVADHLPGGPRAEEVRGLMDAVRPFLAAHPANRRRIEAGQSPVTDIWLWGQGEALSLPTYPDRYGLRGGVVTAVDLVRGIGLLAGLQAPRVEGATGFIDTNYEGKVAAALDLLRDGEFAYIHIEAPDECGHLGDAALKVRAIEDFDARVVGPVRSALDAAGEPYLLLATMDHRTPIALRGHSREPVPAVLFRGPAPADARPGEAPFDESCVVEEEALASHELIDRLLREAASH